MVREKASKSKVATSAKRVRTPLDPASDALVARHRAGLPALRAAFAAALETLATHRLLRPGAIVINSGSAAGGLVAHVDGGGSTLAELDTLTPPAHPMLEVIGDPRRIAAIIRGEKDARMQFFAGGIRVRGDMAYLSAIGTKLGFLDQPLL